jgi:ApaG protein
MENSVAVSEAPYCAVTFDVEVQVAPMYLPDDSAPESGLHVFFYAMRLINRGEMAVAVQTRHFTIRDGNGVERSLEDAGMRGKPVWIQAGESETFSSYCPLPTACGSMRGFLWVEFSDGTEARVEVPVFFLRHQDHLSGEDGLYRSIG